MANTYYDSQLTTAEIESALEAIDGVIVPANNGKVLYIDNGKISAKSVTPGGATLESLSVTQNGDYYPGAGVDGYDEVHVSVPNSYSASDEGKVVNNGVLVAQTSHAKVTANGTYDTTLNDEIQVDVSGGSATLITKSITQNGTYNASSDNADGYSQVTVNVSGGSSISGSVHIWTNTTGSTNASVYVQHGTWNEGHTVFTPDSEAVNILYTGVSGVDTNRLPTNSYDAFGIIALYYYSGWKTISESNLTYNGNTYDKIRYVVGWAYNATVDYYFDVV